MPTSESPNPQHCGKCGAALSAYAPDGLCAACMLESAFEEQDARAEDDAGPTPLLSFSDYELLEEIARGGMGVVYRARQMSLNRVVAIKMILGGHLANAAEMQRFRAEAETAAQLQHPNIVAIHEVGEHAGQPYFSMDLVAGRNLAQWVRDEPLPLRKAAGYLKTIAEAVQFAHSRGVLHRDLKPSNILIDDSDVPRITDFGLAKRLDDSQLSTNDPHLTQTGQVLGSPSFIPPEQAAGHKHAIGPASDVYSLGAILYHCITARPPFLAETMTATLRMVAETEPVSPRLLNVSVPRDLETICLKCLEKDPKRRYATAQELANEIGRFLRDEPVRARPASQAEKAWRWCRRKPALAAATVLVLFLLLVVGIGSSVAAFRISRERRQAEANGNRAQAMADFLASMLEAVGPSKALGRDTTMLREILDKTAERVGKDLKDEPEAEADVRMVLGKTYAELSLYDNALEMANEALRLRLQHFGPENTAVADALANVAAFRLYRGDYPGAEKANREALVMRRKFLGNNHTNVATSLNNLSLAVWNQAKFEEAETYQTEALDIRKRLLGNTNLDVGRSLANLAMVQWVRGNFASAEERMAEALKVFRTQVSDEHPDIASLENNLASMLGKKGELEQAEALHRKTLEVRRRVLNGQHAKISYSLTQLAVVLTARGQLDEAQTHLLEALDMEKKLSLRDHSDAADTLWALGMVVEKKGTSWPPRPICWMPWNCGKSCWVQKTRTWPKHSMPWRL